MADLSPEERLAAHLSEGVAALRRGEPERALLHLRPVAADPHLAATQDLADVRARALTLLAQALIDASVPEGTDGLEALDEAAACLDEAAILDTDSTDAVGGLRDALLDARTQRLEQAARARRTERLAATDVEPLLARIADAGRRLDLLLQKAQAEVDAGRPGSAEAFVDRVLSADEAEVRHQVMARLTLAAALPHQAARRLREAHELADRHGEFNLVATIGRTADLLNVELATLDGPQLSSPRTGDP